MRLEASGNATLRSVRYGGTIHGLFGRVEAERGDGLSLYGTPRAGKIQRPARLPLVWPASAPLRLSFLLDKLELTMEGFACHTPVTVPMALDGVCVYSRWWVWQLIVAGLLVVTAS